jgi:branched-chain amino acid aminotransferase
MKIWLNDGLVAQGTARIDPTDRGFTLGDGVFETIALRDGTPRRLTAHHQRLSVGCQLLGIPLSITETALGEMIRQTAAANEVQRGASRVTLTRGPAGRGLLPPVKATPTLVITVGPAPEPTPIRLMVATSTRRNEQSPLCMIKSLSTLDNLLARREAAAARVDDAVLLNTKGRIAETTIANIFVLEGGGLITPPLNEGAMGGVMRADVIRLARAEEKPVTLEMLARASEVFVTNALGIRPVIAINGTPVGDGEPGLITQMLAVRL